MTAGELNISSVVIEVSFDEKSNCHIASVPGLAGVTARGESWHEAVGALHQVLRSKVDRDEQVRADLDALSSFSGRFSVRVPASVHRALNIAAVAEGVSLNAYVTAVLAEKIGFDVGIKHRSMPQPEVVSEQDLITMLDATTSAGLGTSLRVAHTVFQKVSTAVGLALAIVLGERVLEVQGEAAATDHYGKFARRAYDAGFTSLAIALWRRGLQYQPDNLTSASSLGQVYYKLQEYSKSAEYLKRALDREGRITYVKASLRIAEQEGARADEALLAKLCEIMKEWAFGNANQDDFVQWDAHLAELERLSVAELRSVIGELRAFAAKYSRWKFGAV